MNYHFEGRVVIFCLIFWTFFLWGFSPCSCIRNLGFGSEGGKQKGKAGFLGRVGLLGGRAGDKEVDKEMVDRESDGVMVGELARK